MVLMEEQQVNSYLIRVWRDTSYYLDTITIENNGQIQDTNDFRLDIEEKAHNSPFFVSP